MVRFLTPIILIGIAIAGFFVFTKPIYDNISMLRAEVASYNQALSNSKQLENERDLLTAKYNMISPDNLSRIQTMVPDSIDNIRLILEIGQIASPYGMILQNVKYDANPTTTSTTTLTNGAIQGSGASGQTPASSGYGTWNLGFSTTGSYTNFLNFLKNLESNLRIVDISSVSFSSGTSSTSTPGAAVYTYDVNIQTYWLKN